MHSAEPAPMIGGYRLIRRLHSGSDVVTWLARGDDDVVALRLFSGTAPDARIDAEIGALERLSSAHVPRLLDVATSRDGRPVPVLSAVLGSSLREVLYRCNELRAGHVTTVLAPLAALVTEAHEVGVTLGRVNEDSIRVTSSGTPVFVGIGRLCVSAPLPERFRRQEPAMMTDREELRALVEGLAGRLIDPERRALLEAVTDTGDSPSALELALFDVADPLPLSDEPVLATQRSASPSFREAGRAVTTATASSPVVVARRDRAHPKQDPSRRLSRIASDLGLPQGLLSPIDDLIARFPRRDDRGRRAKAPVVARPRRSVVVAGVAGALAVTLAIALSAGSRHPIAASPTTASTPAPSTGADQIAPPPEESLPVNGRATRSLPESIVDPQPTQWSPLVGELISRWRDCLEGADASCVDAVAYPGSTAATQLVHDRAIGADGEPGHPWFAGEAEPLVVDRLGGAALVDLLDAESRTASLLVMRSEAGWRIRAVMP
jgi:eukaryotic-like serine/threonine-protein kinase